ncbi:MAG: (d)CMP kinase [Desulfuromonadaceae bacterium]|nr:(d)CMP kinase [Desulfuromonadaceae bacterium]
MSDKIIVAIDGPSGSGKSTLSKMLAQRLDFVNIDTGAMYRTVALAAARAGIESDDHPALERLCADLPIRFTRVGTSEKVWLGDEDVSAAIRTPEMSLLSSAVSASPAVRRAMLALQRRMGVNGCGAGVVLEGRDIGTEVFPNAQVKFYLCASDAERGRRRYAQLRQTGQDVTLEQTIAEVLERDHADKNREHAPLRQAHDAIVIDSTAVDMEEILEKMLRYVQLAQGKKV